MYCNRQQKKAVKAIIEFAIVTMRLIIEFLISNCSFLYIIISHDNLLWVQALWDEELMYS